MSETNVDETKPRKVVGRRMFVAIEIVCIILIACLVGATSLYRWQIDDKNNIISTLNSQVTNLQNVVGNFSNIVSVNYSTVIANNETLGTGRLGEAGWMFDASYFGYVSVTIYDSSQNPTDVRVSYSNFGRQYRYEIGVPINWTETFPVMASIGHWCTVRVEILFSNPTYASNRATVTITYYY